MYTLKCTECIYIVYCNTETELTTAITPHYLHLHQLCSGKIGKGLKKFLKKVVIDAGLQEQIAVQDATLGKAIKVCQLAF